jgi:hypothetical protein
MSLYIERDDGSRCFDLRNQIRYLPMIALLARDQQPTDRPNHYVSRKLIDFMLTNSRIRQVGEKIYQLVTVEPLGEIRRSFQKNKLAVRVIPQLLPPDPHQHAMQLTYPPKLEGDRHRELARRREIHRRDTHTLYNGYCRDCGMGYDMAGLRACEGND